MEIEMKTKTETKRERGMEVEHDELCSGALLIR